MQREIKRSFLPLFLLLPSLYFSQITAQGEGEERDADVTKDKDGAEDKDDSNKEDERVYIACAVFLSVVAKVE